MEDLDRVRFIIREFYRFQTRNARIAGWLIQELLTPSLSVRPAGGTGMTDVATDGVLESTCAGLVRDLRQGIH